MATARKIAFRNGEIYHIFNRGIERRTIFTNKREFDRAKDLIKFYKHKDIPIRYSKVMQQPEDLRKKILEGVFRGECLVDILAYCLMPNHFHFLLKQNSGNGLATFISNFSNAYTKYFNTKHQRSGPLLEGIFKAVLVESDEQFIHLSRYIHLNPVTSSIIEEKYLESYEWSSYPEYLSINDENLVETRLVLNMFKSIKDYQEFVVDHIEYAKTLDSIKHLSLE